MLDNAVWDNVREGTVVETALFIVSVMALVYALIANAIVGMVKGPEGEDDE